MTSKVVKISCSSASPIMGIATNNAEAPATALVASIANPAPNKLTPAPIAVTVAPNNANAAPTAIIPAANGESKIETAPIAAIATTNAPIPKARACHGKDPSIAIGAANSVNAAAMAISESAVVPICAPLINCMAPAIATISAITVVNPVAKVIKSMFPNSATAPTRISIEVAIATIDTATPLRLALPIILMAAAMAIN